MRCAWSNNGDKCNIINLPELAIREYKVLVEVVVVVVVVVLVVLVVVGGVVEEGGEVDFGE